jgi:hypothetical protein
MRHEVLFETVDIYQFPVDVLPKSESYTQITIGDLHANAIKLLFMLVKHRIATHINEDDYTRLVAIYRMSVHSLTQQDLHEFNHILSKIQFNTNYFIRLIGDDLADRGNNDYFTLKILEKLHEHAVPFEILISNHSIEFIEACELQHHFYPPMLARNEHALSMGNLQLLIEKQLVTRDDILAIINNTYNRALRAISYALSDNKQDMIIYSHAGIGLNTIENLSLKLGIIFKKETMDELAHTIDAINQQFQQYVQQKKVHRLYSRASMQEAYRYTDCDLSHAPFECILWNRCYQNLDRPYDINFVHGHDFITPMEQNVYVLDNVLGKQRNAAGQLQEMNQGEYRVLLSWNDRVNERVELYSNNHCMLHYQNQTLIFQHRLFDIQISMWIHQAKTEIIGKILELRRLKNELQPKAYAHEVACFIEMLIQTARSAPLRMASLAKDILTHHNDPHRLHALLTTMQYREADAEYVNTLRAFIVGRLGILITEADARASVSGLHQFGTFARASGAAANGAVMEVTAAHYMPSANR